LFLLLTKNIGAYAFYSGAMENQYERLDKRDIFQIFTGSMVGAMSFSVEGGILEIGDRINVIHVVFVVLISVLSSYLISYTLGIRKLGNRRIRLLWGYIPERTTIHYSSALLFSALMLLIFGANMGIPLADFAKRVVVLALPATVTGSAADLIGSQKWRN